MEVAGELHPLMVEEVLPASHDCVGVGYVFCSSIIVVGRHQCMLLVYVCRLDIATR